MLDWWTRDSMDMESNCSSYDLAFLLGGSSLLKNEANESSTFVGIISLDSKHLLSKYQSVLSMNSNPLCVPVIHLSKGYHQQSNLQVLLCYI